MLLSTHSKRVIRRHFSIASNFYPLIINHHFTIKFRENTAFILGSKLCFELHIQVYYLLNNSVLYNCVCDKLRNGATYNGEILHADPCHWLGGSDVDRGHRWEENVLLKALRALKHTAASSMVACGWLVSVCPVY